MNRKLVVSLFLIANATVVSGLAQHRPHRCSLTTAITDDGTQPPAPPPGRSALAVIADGTQPPAPPPGRSTTTSIADGTQPPAPPPGRSAARMRGLSV
jgi:hypothetical protein